MKVKFSIITVCLNAEDTIKQTVDSVLSQTYTNYELIIKDGESSDKTLEMIPHSDVIRVYSQKDKSLYDAMNQAIDFSKGDYLIFMNAGDTFFDNEVLEKVSDFIGENREDIYFGDYYRNGVAVEQPSALSAFTLFRNPLNHQSMFFRRGIQLDQNWYDLKYQILADYDFTVRAFANGKRFMHMPIIVDNYEGNGISESQHGQTLNRNETALIRKKYFKAKYLLYMTVIFLTFPKLRQWLVKDSTPRVITKTYRIISNRINRSL